MNSIITIEATTINGDFYEFPKTLNLKREEVIPIGVDVVLSVGYNGTVAKTFVFLLQYGLELIGTTQFKNINEWNYYVNFSCCDNSNLLMLNGCYLKINSDKIGIVVQHSTKYIILNGCNTTINGCILHK